MPTTRQSSMFRTPVHCFFPTFIHALRKTWFELSRVEICRNDLRENKNYFELAGGSSYQGARVTEGKITIKVQRKSVGNRFWFELARARVMGGRLYSFRGIGRH